MKRQRPGIVWRVAKRARRWGDGGKSKGGGEKVDLRERRRRFNRSMSPNSAQRRATARAFTLIELLIVVAIIAILAAIAVPNFIEAQTRSKTSRVKSDMRSLATGIEAYSVDHNRYPISSQWINGPNAPSPQNFNNRMRGLTTPVSYITTLPVDVFWDKTQVFPITPGVPPTFEYNDYSTAVVGQNFAPLPTYNLFNTRISMSDYYGRTGTVDWAMQSSGPDRVNDFQTTTVSPLVKPVVQLIAYQEGLRRTYDPTNGTVSVGDIARTNTQQRN